MSGIVLGSYWPGGFYPAMAMVIGCGVAMGYAVWRGLPALLVPLLFCIGLGYLSIRPWVGGDLPDGHVAHYIDQGKWRISGVVADHPVGKEGRGRFVIDARRLERGRATSHPVTGNIAVSVIGDMPDVARGDTVQVSGSLRAIRSFCNPGGFDYERFMALQGVHVRLTSQSKNVVLVSRAVGEWSAGLERARHVLLSEMTGALQGYSSDAVAVFKALTMGDRTGIRPNLQEAFNRSGVAHVLSISGVHIGMVAVVGFGIGFRVLAWTPFLRRRGWVHRGAALIALCLVLGYGGLSGLSAATQRAMLMTSVFLLTYWVGRRHDWLNTLAVAALVVVVVFPPALFRVSFQLSFAAVATMLVGLRLSPLHPPEPAALWRRWASRLHASVWVSVLAILGTLPLVLRYFNLFSLVGPLTNLAVVPLTGMIVVPVGLLGIVCWPLSPLLAVWCWKFAVLCLAPQCWLIEKMAAWPWCALNTVTPSMVELVLFYLLLALVLTWKQWGSWRRIALIAILSVATVDLGYWVYQRYLRSTLVATAVDVGQGGATLLELPGGYTVLVDGGGFGDNSVFDTGARIVAPLLWRKKIRTIDLMILTHPDSDHLNGLIYLLRHFKIRQIWSTGDPAESIGYRNWLQTIAEQGIDHPSFQSLPDRLDRNGAAIELLGPVRDFLRRRSQEPWRDSNASAMVLRVSMGRISLLLPADITARAEEELVRRHAAERLRSTVLFVPHHGSRTSSTMRLLQAVQPAEAVISLGWQNRFNFPHAVVVERLRAIGARVWRTDLCGAIRIETDGNDYRMTSCRPQCP
jgi:competence protein ComEC